MTPAELLHYMVTVSTIGVNNRIIKAVKREKGEKRW